MKFGKTLLLTFSAILLTLQIRAQEDILVKSVQFYPEGNVIGTPILALGSSNQLILEFDLLLEDAINLNYTIEHYTYDWQPSNLSPLEYIVGFSSHAVRDYEYSFDTDEYYVHYKVDYPNNTSKPKVSGNYKLIVYEDSPKEPLVERRFMVVEQVVPIQARLSNVPNLRMRKSHHQIGLTANIEGFNASNPRESFKVNIYQNNRPDNMLYDVRPTRYTSKELIFNEPFKLHFDAGNEFRWFNTKSTRFLTETIAERIEKEDGTHIYLIPDQVKKTRVFAQQKDLNGRFYIDHQEGTNADLDAEYLFIHFTLQEQPSLQGKDIYVYGELTDWKLKEEFKMEYNASLGFLESVAYLKQGNYDYTYVVVDGDEISSSTIDGSDYQTENDYTVYLYYSPFSARYDRLVGVTQLNSRFN